MKEGQSYQPEIPGIRKIIEEALGVRALFLTTEEEDV